MKCQLWCKISQSCSNFRPKQFHHFVTIYFSAASCVTLPKSNVQLSNDGLSQSEHRKYNLNQSDYSILMMAQNRNELSYFQTAIIGKFFCNLSSNFISIIDQNILRFSVRNLPLSSQEVKRNYQFFESCCSKFRDFMFLSFHFKINSLEIAVSLLMGTAKSKCRAADSIMFNLK